MKSSLEEHSLELRVKAATEAESACQQRLSFAEAELEELRAKVDASERFVFCSREQCYVYKLEQLIVVDSFNETYLKTLMLFLKLYLVPSLVFYSYMNYHYLMGSSVSL